jgi:predicted dehydrogenase
MNRIAPYRLGLIGVGKIARDQHLPALAASDRFDLVACADPMASLPGVPSFRSFDDLLAHGPAIDAVSICTPPAGRGAIVTAALNAGLHVMMEKPPAATLSEVEAMTGLAAARDLTLFAAWHSREAGGVARARAWLADRLIERVSIVWREDIRRWHPGQDWILAAGGYGVFDPGINALSIATAILPEPLTISAATMTIPEGRQSPIAARLHLACGSATGTAEFDFLQQGPQHWDIKIAAGGERMILRDGGSAIQVDGAIDRSPDREYPRLYQRFAALIDGAASDVDVSPLRLVADAFLIAERVGGPSFSWNPEAANGPTPVHPPATL